METTFQLWEAIDGEAILDIRNNIYITVLTVQDDGIFLTENEWIEFVEEVDKYGSYYLAENWLEQDGAETLVDGNKITYKFDRPVQVVTGFQLVDGEKELTISDVNEMTIEVDYEWSFLKGYDHLNIATFIDIFGKVTDVR